MGFAALEVSGALCQLDEAGLDRLNKRSACVLLTSSQALFTWPHMQETCGNTAGPGVCGLWLRLEGYEV